MYIVRNVCLTLRILLTMSIFVNTVCTGKKQRFQLPLVDYTP